MTFVRRPRVFLSYRHAEPHGWFGAKRYNANHRAWVNRFAESLASWDIDVVWDDRLRKMFKSASDTDPNELPFLAEISTLCLQVTQTFMPVLTRGYVERINGAGGASGYGTVTEEWLNGVGACAAQQAEIVTIVREWPIPGIQQQPPPIANTNAWDYRFVDATPDETELLADILNGVWQVERPAIDMPFGDLIRRYTKYCVEALGLPWPGIENWGCDFERPRLFLRLLAEEAENRPIDPREGSQRDLREISGGVPADAGSPVTAAGQQASIDPEQLAAEEKAKDLMRNVMLAHEAGFRKPFDFAQRAPGGRASKGLYFGRTVRGFSHLHAADPNLPR